MILPNGIFKMVITETANMKLALPWENQSSEVCNQIRLKAVCSVTEACWFLEILGIATTGVVLSIPFVTSFRRMFYVYHQAMKHHHTNIILSLFSIPFVLKCAAKILKLGL